MPKSLQKAVVKVLASGTQSTAPSSTGNLRTAAVGGFSGADAVTLKLDVTSHLATFTGQLIFTVDGSYDGGTTWQTLLQFITITTSTSQQQITFRPTGLGPSEVASHSGVATTTTGFLVNNVVIPPDHRVAWAVGSGTTGFVSWAGTIVAYVQPFGTAGA